MKPSYTLPSGRDVGGVGVVLVLVSVCVSVLSSAANAVSLMRPTETRKLVGIPAKAAARKISEEAGKRCCMYN